MRFLVLGIYPLGALLGGAVGDRFGVHATLWVIAVGLACAPLPVLLSPVVHMRDLTHSGLAYELSERGSQPNQNC